MDLQLGPTSRARILPNADEGGGAGVARTSSRIRFPLVGGLADQANAWRDEILNQAPKAEALAGRCIISTRPIWSWLALEWRRLGTVAVLLLTVGILLHAVFGANGMVVYRQKRDELKTLQNDVDLIQKENDGYEARLKALKSDPNAIEKEAREQLHYTRPGEMVYVLPEPSQKPATGRAKNDK